MPVSTTMSKAPAAKLWLVKVPKFLAESWRKQGPGSSLGTLEPVDTVDTTVAGPSGKQAYKLTMSSDAGPMEYTMTVTEPPGAMYCFLPEGPDARGGEMRLEGKIDAKWDLNAAEVNASYKQLVRDRQESAAARPEIGTTQADILELGGVTQRLQKQGELSKQARELKKRKDRAEQRAEEAKRTKKVTQEEPRDVVFKANTDLPHTRSDCVVNLFPRDNPSKEVCPLICSKRDCSEYTYHSHSHSSPPAAGLPLRPT